MSPNSYWCDCEGCQKEVEINVYGFIGIIENVWCDECGYEGDSS
tara:strand:- start:6647 stop:6778 length:132 start_codon:yes stop_codon:yes gene_type:complete